MKKFTRISTPIFNSPNLSEIFSHPLPLDNQNLLRVLEVILFKNSSVEVVEERGQVVKVRCEDYPSSIPLYTDIRFLSENGQIAEKKMPSLDVLVQRLRERVGQHYIWGGNVCEGLESMLHFYPPNSALSEFEKKRWMFKGCDCSGLLYEATEGITPRNVCWLLEYGIELRHYDKLLPLDLLIWPGHVVIALNDQYAIESKCEWGGVVITNMKDRLRWIEKERKDGFMIRRFHPETLERR